NRRASGPLQSQAQQAGRIAHLARSKPRARRAEEGTRTPSAWVVLKFGGRSVSTLANWTNIARVAAERRSAGARVLIVHSAISGITDRLERVLDIPEPEAQKEQLRAIEERHRALAAELGVPLGDDVERQLEELREMAAGVARSTEVTDRTRARVLATGELMGTQIGARFLRSRGLEVAGAGARTVLRAAARDLDRRARHVQRQPARDAERAAAARAPLRRGAGDRDQRRQGAAPALHPARSPVRHSAARLCDPGAGPRRHGALRREQHRGGAAEGGVLEEGHHAHLHG